MDAQIKWYYKPVWIIVIILGAGPFALPLVWLSPALKKWHKIALTIALVIFTIWFARASIAIYRDIMKEMAELQSIMK